MTNKFSLIALIYVIVCMSVLPFIWLPKDYLINGEDQLFTNYEILLDKAAYSWTNFSAYGGPANAGNHGQIIPNAYFYKLLRSGGFPMDITQKLFISTNILLMLLSFWLFASLLTKNRFVILLSLLVYFLNFYVAVSFTYTGKIFQLILTPLLFYLTYKYLEQRTLKYLAYHFIILFIFQGIFTNLTQLIALLPTYLFSTLFYGIQKNKKNFTLIKPLVVFISVTLSIYIYHGLVYYFSLFKEISAIREVTTFSALFADLYKMFQMRGVWWEDSSFLKDIPYYAWNVFFNNTFIIILSYAVILIILYLVLIVNKINKVSLFFLLLYLFYFAASTGLSFLPWVYKWLYKNFPLFFIFREPWPKFTPGVILAFSSLVILAFENLKIKSSIYRLLYLIILIAVLIKGFPFFSPDFYFKWKRDVAKIPQYWVDYRDWTLTKRDNKILPIPFFTSRHQFRYNWYKNQPGNTDTEMPFIFSASNVIRYYGYDFFSLMVTSSLKNNNFDFVKIAKTDYFLIQKDISIMNNANEYSWQESSAFNYIQQEPEAVFGNKLFIYKIKPVYQISDIYIPNSIKTITQSKRLLDDNFLSDANTGTVVFPIFENGSKILKLDKVDFEDKTSTNTKYQKINPSKYKVTILHAKKPFPLILQETYAPEWKILLNNNSALEESNHLLVNGFLNSWILDPQEICAKATCKTHPDKSYDISLTIEYWPQRWFDIVYNFNLAIFSLSLLYCLYKLIHFSFTKIKTNI